MSESPSISVGGVTHAISELSSEIKYLVQLFHHCDLELKQIEKEVFFAETAKNTYIQSIKDEIDDN